MDLWRCLKGIWNTFKRLKYFTDVFTLALRVVLSAILSLNDYKMLLSASVHLWTSFEEGLDYAIAFIQVASVISSKKLVVASKRLHKFTYPISRWNHKTRGERTKMETLLHQVKLLRYVITILHKRSTSGWLYAAIAQRSPIHSRGSVSVRHWRSLARQPFTTRVNVFFDPTSGRDGIWSIVKNAASCRECGNLLVLKHDTLRATDHIIRH